MMLYESLHFQASDHYEHPASDRLNERRPSAPSITVSKLRNGPREFGRTNSYVVGQKLRESKWLGHDEMKIFCAVVESGFIVERKTEDEPKMFGVVIWDTGFEKSKDPEKINVYSLKDCKGILRVYKYTIWEFWPADTLIRINNHSDKTETPHPEDVIKKHIALAEKKKLKWHNSEHFTYWCRYAQVDLTRGKHLKPVWNKLSEGSNIESKANYYGWKEKIRRYIYGKDK